MLMKPKYLEWCVWDYSDPSFPKLKGFKKDTPPEIIEEFKRESKLIEKANAEGTYL